MLNLNRQKRIDVIITRGGSQIIDATFRNARGDDVRAINELSKPFVATGGLIARDLDLFQTHVNDFYVMEIDRTVVACAGIRRFDTDAEIFNVAVDGRWQGFGVGRLLLATMLIVLDAQGHSRAIIFSKTTSGWFAKLGFTPIDPASLPAKRVAMIDPERNSIPMARATLRAEDGIDAPPHLAEPRIRFARSDAEYGWQGTVDSLLPFAEKNGIVVDSLCWGGVCGTCSTRLTQGTVSYDLRPDVIPTEGEVLLCIARPVTDLVLDL